MKKIVRKNSILIELVIFLVLIFSFGCAEREEPITAPCSTLIADNALREAEAKLESVGIVLSFDEPGELVHPENLIPDPADLAGEEKQRTFEEVIDQLNMVLAEIEREAQVDTSCSVSDQALVHLYLGFAYIFDSISRLLNSDDPGETFIIGFDPDASNSQWYTFDVSLATHAKLDATQDPLYYPLAFTTKERQAIIDAADLMDDAVAKPVSPKIKPRISSVHRPPYSNYAIWHFDRAASLFGEYQPEVMDALNEFNESVEDMRKQLQNGAESWGFTYTLPPWRKKMGT